MAEEAIPPCGTYAAYQRHGRLGEERCDPCRQAAKDYMTSLRQKPGGRTKDRWWNKTRNAALERLAQEYPARLLELLDEERASTSLPEVTL
jgi:hypothetical protein